MKVLAEVLIRWLITIRIPMILRYPPNRAPRRYQQIVAIAFALIAIFQHPVSSAEQKQRRPDYASVQVATEQWENGKPDKSRLFIFYFYYLGKSVVTPGYCDVVSITVNNIGCEKESIGEGRGFWLKPEYANIDYKGRENFVCKLAQTSEKDAELTVTESDPLMTFTHRLKLTRDAGDREYRLTDYRGGLIKSSSITKQIETVEYRPLVSRSESVLNGGWENVRLACNQMTVPVIVRERSQAKPR